MFLVGSVIRYNTFTGNTAAYGAGGYNDIGTNQVTSNTFLYNNATINGGGIYGNGGTKNINNNVFSENSAVNGAAVYTYNNAAIENNTFYNNSASTSGGGVYTEIGTNSISNCIFWGNKIGSVNTVIGADYFNNGGANTFKNSFLQLANTNYTTNGSGSYDIGTVANATANFFAVDPIFTNPSDIDGVDNIHRTTDDGLSLQNSSPCVNAGVVLPILSLFDITGTPRTQGASIDIGAYERDFECPTNTILYVDNSKTISGNGTSWANAYKTLDEALKDTWLCPNFQKIYVAQGTYKPTKKPYIMVVNKKGVEISTSNARDVTFHIRTGLEIQGGFPSGGGSQNIASNPTILSGDIGVLSNATDNTYHVVLADSSANWATTGSITKINGFTIKNGNCNGVGTLSLNNKNIYSDSGAGIYVGSGTNNISDNTITSNNCVNYAAIFTENSSKNIIVNNTIANNTGVGIYAWNCINTINNNSILSNTGCGVVLDNGTNTLNSNTFKSNTNINGAGIYIISGNNKINNCVFAENISSNWGGAINIANGTNSVVNCTFSKNNAGIGGGVLTNNGTNYFYNNIFSGNKQNSSIVTAGADYYSAPSATNTFKNCLLQFPITQYTSTATGSYHLGVNSSSNIFNANTINNPLFVDDSNIAGSDGVHRTSDDGLRVYSNSPIINMGDNSLVQSGTLSDISGAVRIQNTIVDIGAYEGGVPVVNCTSSATTLFVDANISASGDGETWSTAYKTIDEALYRAWQCTSISNINVATGTYLPSKKPYSMGTNKKGTEMITTDSRDATFHIRTGLNFQGGFPNGGGSQNPIANGTILSGNIGALDSTDNSYHVVVIDSSANWLTIGSNTIINGFKITNGNASGSFPNNVFMLNGYNLSRSSGGGIILNSGYNTLNNTSVVYNLAVEGAGIFAQNGNSIISNNVIFNNTSSRGGGLYLYNNIKSNVFNNALAYNIANNPSYGTGGGIQTYFGTHLFTNNTFFRNFSFNGGGGICTIYGINTVINSIFYQNKAQSSFNFPGADYYNDGSLNTFKNNLLQRAALNYTNTATGNYSLGTTAMGNIFAQDPSFIDTLDIDGLDNIYRTSDDGLNLSCGSPAINAVTNTGAPALDILGNTIYGGTKDMGAYESQTDCLNTVYSNFITNNCNIYTVSNVSGNQWYNVVGASGIICSINPNGENLGNLTISINDPIGVSTYGLDKFLGRSINISSTNYPSGNIPSDYSLRLYYLDSEFEEYKIAVANTSLQLSDLNVVWISGGSGCTINNYASTATSNGTVMNSNISNTNYGIGNNAFYLQFDLNHFTLFAPTEQTTLLPVKLLSFNGKNEGKYNTLTWETASERNNKGFDVERSNDGVHFEKLDFVASLGNSDNKQRYSFIDKIHNRINYYRLKQIDIDGKFEYSKTINVNAALESDEVRIYPNPSQDIFNIDINNYEQPFELYNNIGQIVMQGKTISQTLDLSAYSAGIYFLKIQDKTLKMIKK